MKRITLAKAGELRDLLDNLTEAVAQLDDDLDTLQDDETKGEDRDDATDMFESDLLDAVAAFDELKAKVPGGAGRRVCQ